MKGTASPLLVFVASLAAALACGSCSSNPSDPHASPEARAKQCVDCHQTAYSLTRNPAHASLFPTTCATCHDTQAWTPATVPAAEHPIFKLDGAHASTPCAQCHPGTPARYSGTPTTCASCHAADFQRAAGLVAGHATFPSTCDTCHSTTAWKPTLGGMGTHPESLFPITTGSHANKAIACTDCHIASLGSPVKGANCDCIHCHLGAHNEPATDTTHATMMVPNYKPTPASMPNGCRTCHGAG
jgi:hypothetical protein